MSDNQINHYENQQNYEAEGQPDLYNNPEYYGELPDNKKHQERYADRSMVLPSKSKSKGKGNTSRIQNQSELPDILDKTGQNKRSKIIEVAPSILRNKNIKYLFKGYCKQVFTGQLTFDQVSQNVSKMSINKWMLFCKQFQLVQEHNNNNKQKKLHRKDAIDCFRQATNYKAQMDVDQFLRGLQLIKEKINFSEQELITDILHAESHVAARNRLTVVKIDLTGPPKNFFLEGTYTENQRYQRKMKEKLFKQREKKRLGDIRQKQKTYILHQGMARQHIERQMGERKQKRQQRTERLRNRSQLQPLQMQRYRKQTSNPDIYLTEINSQKKHSKSVFNTYSKVFQTNKKRDQHGIGNRSFAIHQRLKNNQSTHISTQSKSRLYYEGQKMKTQNASELHNSQQIKQQENKQQLNQRGQSKSALKNWEDQLEINSEAQSDQILRDHFKNQKKFKGYYKKKVDQRYKQFSQDFNARSSPVKANQTISVPRSNISNNNSQTGYSNKSALPLNMAINTKHLQETSKQIQQKLQKRQSQRKPQIIDNKSVMNQFDDKKTEYNKNSDDQMNQNENQLVSKQLNSVVVGGNQKISAEDINSPQLKNGDNKRDKRNDKLKNQKQSQKVPQKQQQSKSDQKHNQYAANNKNTETKDKQIKGKIQLEQIIISKNNSVAMQTNRQITTKKALDN